MICHFEKSQKLEIMEIMQISILHSFLSCSPYPKCRVALVQSTSSGWVPTVRCKKAKSRLNTDYDIWKVESFRNFHIKICVHSSKPLSEASDRICWQGIEGIWPNVQLDPRACTARCFIFHDVCRFSWFFRLRFLKTSLFCLHQGRCGIGVSGLRPLWKFGWFWWFWCCCHSLFWFSVSMVILFSKTEVLRKSWDCKLQLLRWPDQSAAHATTWKALITSWSHFRHYDILMVLGEW